jgi:HK97 family phage portal protein
MRFFGFELRRAKAAPVLSSVDDRRGWVTIIRESFLGAWQQNVEVDFDNVVSHHAVYACVTLIASDIAKLRVKLVERAAAGVWSEVEVPAFSPVLRKPNHFQTRIQFWENWIVSKLLRGNTLVLKERDARGVVVGLVVLDWCRVKPLVSPRGDVFYELQADKLADIAETMVVPASEVIHDRMNCLFHPLIGLSPIYASGLSATQGISIQTQATKFFQNSARPSGILTAPGAISDETATRLKDQWEEKFGGANSGRVAVLGDGLKFERMTMTSSEAQMIEQLKWTAEVVCSTFHVPPYKVGVGVLPSYNNIQSLNVEYYSQCLQSLIEAAELCLDEGLGLFVDKNRHLGTEFDVDNLLRMDSVTQMDVLDKGVKAGVLSPNEARAQKDLPPVTGGEVPYLQQQNYSLAALARRDALADPFTSGPAAPPPGDQTNDNGADPNLDEQALEDSSKHYFRALLPPPSQMLRLTGPAP